MTTAQFQGADDFVPGWTVEADGRFVRLVKTHPDETGALLPTQARRLARLLTEASTSIEEASNGT